MHQPAALPPSCCSGLLRAFHDNDAVMQGSAPAGVSASAMCPTYESLSVHVDIQFKPSRIVHAIFVCSSKVPMHVSHICSNRDVSLGSVFKPVPTPQLPKP